MLIKKESPRYQTTGNQKTLPEQYTINKKQINPPYSNDLLYKLQNTRMISRDIFVFIGKYAWKKAKATLRWEKVLVLPEEDKPEHYAWAIVKKQPVLLYDTNPSGSDKGLIKNLIDKLLEADAQVVRLINAQYVLVGEFRSQGDHYD